MSCPTCGSTELGYRMDVAIGRGCDNDAWHSGVTPLAVRLMPQSLPTPPRTPLHEDAVYSIDPFNVESWLEESTVILYERIMDQIEISLDSHDDLVVSDNQWYVDDNCVDASRGELEAAIRQGVIEALTGVGTRVCYQCRGINGRHKLACSNQPWPVEPS